jgi:hypothetical protein
MKKSSANRAPELDVQEDKDFAGVIGASIVFGLDYEYYRMLNVPDEFTHECLAIRVARKLKAIDVIRSTSSAGGSRCWLRRTTLAC